MAAVWTFCGEARAQFRLDTEGGVGISGYNDVRIPGQGGTTFSFRDDLDTERTIQGRVRVAWEPGRHHVSVLAVGATALLRVAEIRLSGGGRTLAKSNTGVVPLLRLQGDVALARWLGVGVEAEGLASPQGRAFDVAAALLFPFADRWTGRVGYRFIEGGADNDEVYNFTWLHLPFVGLSLSL